MARWRQFGVMLLLMVGGVATAEEVPHNKLLIGLHEKVHIKQLDIILPAKIDTGAQSASLSATHIRELEKDGRRMVEFDLALSKETREEWGLDKEKLRAIRLPLDGHVRIKRRAESRDADGPGYSERPVVKLRLCMGGRDAAVKVNLTDRSRFRYPLLVGADALRTLEVVVDPSVSMGSGRPDCAASESSNKE